MNHTHSPESVSQRKMTLLNGLEPIAAGTSMRESLYSYLQRLAASHCLAPNTLVREVIAKDGSLASLLALNESEQDFMRCVHRMGWGWGWGWYQHDGKTMVGCGSMASTWATALTQATGRTDMAGCTLTAYATHLAHTNLITPFERHCPQCLDEDRTQGKDTYSRLLWRIGAVQCCPTHKLKLVHHQCGNSAKAKLSPRARVQFPGVCSDCGAIGYHCNAQRQHMDDPAHVWRAQEVEQMLNMHEPLTLRDLDAMKFRIKQHASQSGGLACLAKRMGTTKSVVHHWINSPLAKISLEHLLDLCAAEGLSLPNLLRGNLVPVLTPSDAQAPTRTPRKNKPVDHEELRRFMSQGIDDGRSLSDIARQAGVDRGTLKVHQDLFNRLKAVSLDVQRDIVQERRSNHLELVDRTLRKMIKDALALSLRNASKITGDVWLPSELRSQLLSLIVATIQNKPTKKYVLGEETIKQARQVAARLKEELNQDEQMAMF